MVRPGPFGATHALSPYASGGQTLFAVIPGYFPESVSLAIAYLPNRHLPCFSFLPMRHSDW
jgi:hypothetical protein